VKVLLGCSVKFIGVRLSQVAFAGEPPGLTERGTHLLAMYVSPLVIMMRFGALRISICLRIYQSINQALSTNNHIRLYKPITPAR